MRRRRVIVAVALGIGLTGLLSATARPYVTSVTQEAVAAVLPASAADSVFNVLTDVTAAVAVALPGVALAVVLVLLGGPIPTETRCRQCGYILRGLAVPRCPEFGTSI